jgi:tetraacyldisaccharide 4'-kinase
MRQQDIHIDKWLIPLSRLYGVVVNIRNFLFDKQLLLHTRCFDIPIICVGNLAVGGTGKTPHTEYLIRLLQKNFNIAVLSRGYKRQTKDYVLANARSTAQDIGDEPFQILKKFPNVRVAVDGNRCRGISNLMKLRKPAVDVILLDDAFQHRYVNAGLNIVLTNFERPFFDDELLPAGRLREPAHGKVRAQIMVVTKCPEDIKPIQYNVTAKGANLLPYQKLFFSKISYGSLYAMFKSNKIKTIDLADLKEETSVLLITGVANPRPLLDKLKEHVEEVVPMSFSDHHDFTVEDVKKINAKFDKLPKDDRLIITTEKDAARLRYHSEMSPAVKKSLFILPIKIDILQNKEDSFNQTIIDYVNKNKRNSNISTK